MADPFGNFTSANHSDDLDLGAGRLVAEPRSGDNAAPIGVGELAARLKRVVEQEFGHVRLRGEVSGYKRVASGHAYLCLKDEGAVIDGVIWKAQVAALAFVPQDGIEVIATGRITTYPGRSKYQIVIDRLELAGEGALMALLDKIKAKLAGEGLFDVGRKQRLPFLPRVIGVVTSPTGAVIRDILHRLADRCPTHVLVWPVVVQGEGAAAQIARAIAGFDALPPGAGPGSVPRPDLVIVARGGGSIEDLWAFNEEVVVRAIAACRIPIISAVGHETDTTLGDFAADLRAPTPSAAAELAVPVLADLRGRLDSLGERAGRCAVRYHVRGHERLGAIVRVLPRRDLLLAPQRRRADDLAGRLDRGLAQRVTRARGALHRSGGGLRLALLDRALDRARERLRGAEALAAALDPDNVLGRGYVRVTTRGNRTLTTAADARAAGAVTLLFRDGPVAASVETGSAPGQGTRDEPAGGVERGGAGRYDRGKAPVRPARGAAAPEQPTLL